MMFSTPANIALGEAKIPLLEIRFRYLARNFVTRILTNEDHPLRTKLEEIIIWKENPMNLDRVDTVPIIEAFKDIVCKEHLIGRTLATIMFCNYIYVSHEETKCRDRQRIETSSIIRVDTSLSGPFLRRNGGKTEASHRWLQIIRRILRGFSVFDYNVCHASLQTCGVPPR
jgi:hypothetical protein